MVLALALLCHERRVGSATKREAELGRPPWIPLESGWRSSTAATTVCDWAVVGVWVALVLSGVCDTRGVAKGQRRWRLACCAKALVMHGDCNQDISLMVIVTPG